MNNSVYESGTYGIAKKKKKFVKLCFYSIEMEFLHRRGELIIFL